MNRPDNEPDLPAEIGALTFVTLDVRPLLAVHKEPFAEIMGAVSRLDAEEGLRLLAPFEPVPLYAVLGKKGFLNWGRERKEDSGEAFWEIFFYPGQDRPKGSRKSGVDGRGSGEPEALELDVRGLEPPEPMQQVLSLVEGLRYGDVLLVHHHRDPVLLYPVLEERGFRHRSQQVSEDYWQVRIWRKQ